MRLLVFQTTKFVIASSCRPTSSPCEVDFQRLPSVSAESMAQAFGGDHDGMASAAGPRTFKDVLLRASIPDQIGARFVVCP